MFEKLSCLMIEIFNFQHNFRLAMVRYLLSYMYWIPHNLKLKLSLKYFSKCFEIWKLCHCLCEMKLSSSLCDNSMKNPIEKIESIVSYCTKFVHDQNMNVKMYKQTTHNFKIRLRNIVDHVNGATQALSTTKQTWNTTGNKLKINGEQYNKLKTQTGHTNTKLYLIILLY